MTVEEAIYKLKIHSGTISEGLTLDWTIESKPKGLIDSLRPYKGNLRKDFLEEIDLCLLTLEFHLKNSPKIERELSWALWEILSLTFFWALDSRGMLRRNNLIDKVDLEYLENWHFDFAQKVSECLGTMDEGLASPNH